MKILINGITEMEVGRVDIVHENYPEEGQDTYLKMTHKGMMVDVVEGDEVDSTGCFFLEDLVGMVH